MSKLKIVIVPVTAFQQNCSLLIDGSHFVVVDPGGDIPTILEAIKKHVPNPICDGIFLTHSHIDHCGGVAALLTVLTKSLGSAPKLYGHRADQPLRESIEQQSVFFGLSPLEYRNCPEPDVYLAQDHELRIGSFAGRALFTPGHAPGHLSLYFPKFDFSVSANGRERDFPQTPVVIAGDALFAGSVGRTDLPFCSHEQLISSIREQLFTLPGDTLVLPGHGPSTTVGVEVKTNPHF